MDGRLEGGWGGVGVCEGGVRLVGGWVEVRGWRRGLEGGRKRLITESCSGFF